jgi:hypothetical protein
VPRTLLPLLQHMFLEQLPIIISTLKLLKQWAAQQQHVQPQQQQQTAKGRPQVQPPPGWLLLPRSLGMDSFQLFDPSTGLASFSGSKASSAYAAWRAAEMVGWYKALDNTGRAAVQQLLCDIGAAGVAAEDSSCNDKTTNHVEAAFTDGCSSAGEKSRAGVLAAAVAASPPTAVAVGKVDAVAAFEELVRCVEECGQLARISNRIMLRPAAAAGFRAQQGTAAGRHGGGTQASKL